MTGPRTPHTRPSSTLTGGDDRPATPCKERWFPFEVLIERTGGDQWRSAVDEARGMCARCPIWQTCLVENRDEEWAIAVTTGKSIQQRAAEKQHRSKHGTPAGYRKHLRRGEKACEPCRDAEAARSSERRAA